MLSEVSKSQNLQKIITCMYRKPDVQEKRQKPDLLAIILQNKLLLFNTTSVIFYSFKTTNLYKGLGARKQLLSCIFALLFLCP